MPMTTTYAPPDVTRSGAVADLLLRVSDGDPAAWEEILHRYGRLVTATVRSFRLQHADTLDAVQRTWLRLAENAHRIRRPEGLPGCLVTTARRECLHILSQAKRTSAPLDVVDPSVDGPEQRVIDADTARTLWALVEELSPRQRTLLWALFTDYPRPYTEVARITGIPLGAIGPTRARALAQLRGKLEHTSGRAHRLPVAGRWCGGRGGASETVIGRRPGASGCRTSRPAQQVRVR